MVLAGDGGPRGHWVIFAILSCLDWSVSNGLTLTPEYTWGSERLTADSFKAAVFGSERLTADSFKAAVFGSGKATFINFMLPDQDESKLMKPMWDKLGRYFYNSKNALIADVDCSSDSEGRDLCDTHRVQKYPMLVSYKENSKSIADAQIFHHEEELKRIKERHKEHAYTMGYPMVKKYAKQYLGAKPDQCNFWTLDTCTEDELKIVNDPHMRRVPRTNMRKLATGLAKERDKMDAQHVKQVHELNAKYKGLKRKGPDKDLKREMKELWQDYKAERHKLQRKIKLTNHLGTKNWIDKLLFLDDVKNDRLPENYDSHEGLDPEMEAQMKAMTEPRVFEQGRDGSWEQVRGPRAEDFVHLPHSIFHDPSVWDPNKPAEEYQDSAHYDEQLHPEHHLNPEVIHSAR